MGKLSVLTVYITSTYCGYESHVLQEGHKEGTFTDLYSGYRAEQKVFAVNIGDIERRLRKVKDRETDARRFAEAAAKYTDATVLSRDMITDLIERIVAHQAEGTQCSNRRQTKDFYFRFIGKFPNDFFNGLVSQ